MSEYKNTSFWFNEMGDEPSIRPPLSGDIDADIVIVGAGYTGLWTAYYLKSLSPQSKVVVLEADIAGYGASGRNGGWVAGYITGLEKYLMPLPMADRRACCQALFDNVDTIGEKLKEENISADFHKGGVLYAAARYPEQLAAQRALLNQLYQAGHTEDDCWWLDAYELGERVRMHNGLGAVFKRHCATVNPARMVRGLAEAVEKRGVELYEKTPATAIGVGKVVTANGVVRAPIVVPALEGYSPTVKGFDRYLIPVQSLIVATEPLSDSLWDKVGLANREAFCDGSRMISYGQRSSDDRMIFGARGGYVYGGKPRSQFSLEDKEFRMREQLLYDLFPMLKDVSITHGWGGSLGMPRNFAPHAIFDRASGLATAGGYGGQGVGPAHLFGRTLADLILGRETELTHMPWVFNQDSALKTLRRWEPEPFRWLTSEIIIKSFTWEENLCQKKPNAVWRKALSHNISNALSLLMR